MPVMDDPAANARTNDDPNATVRTLLDYAAAAALLGITSDAVRMKCRRGTLACETVEGRRLVVWPQPERANERRTPNGDRDRRSGEPVRSDAAAQRVTTLQAQLARAERERDDWQAAYRDQSDRLDAAMTLAATAQRLAERERERADALAATVDRLRALPEQANERTPFVTVGEANATGPSTGNPHAGPAGGQGATDPRLTGVETLKRPSRAARIGRRLRRLLP